MHYLNPDVSDIHAQAGIAGTDVMIARMMARPYYSHLFAVAYGTADITQERIADALASYLSALSSAGTQQAIAADPRFADPFR
jgi:cytochrome c peroxidase